MMSRLTTFILLLLLIISCKHDEEIVPVPPPTQEKEPETPPDVNEDEKEDKPAEGAETDFFLYGNFRDIPYRILLPRKYDPAQHYPLHIFLHGAGERGRDNEKQLTIGSSFFLADSVREKYRAIIVYPQCPETEFWFDEDMTASLKDLVDTLQDQYSVMKEHISIGGFSMGAYGTFAMVARYPRYFEAAVAISGDGNELEASSMAESRWNIFAGEKDEVVPSIKTKMIADALKNAGASVLFTLYPDANHDATWPHALAEPGLFQWLFLSKNANEPEQTAAD